VTKRQPYCLAGISLSIWLLVIKQMAEEAILIELKALRLDMNRLLGIRLDQNDMADRLGITTRTLYNRIRAGTVPLPSEGRWLLANVVEWETQTMQ